MSVSAGWKALAHRSYGVLAVRLLVCFSLLFLALPAHAQTPADERLGQIRFEQRLNTQVPLDLVFRNENGAPVALRDYFGVRPVILTLGYYECPMLCSMVRDGLFESLQALDFDVGKDFAVINVSIDPDEPAVLAAATKALYVQRYARPGAAEGWHFLTGTEDSIRHLAEAIGFAYAYDPVIDQYAHPSGIVLLTPQGKISRYFYGIEFAPRDLRLGLVEASANKIGSPIDQVLLRCYQYDPVTGRYTVAILTILQIAGVAAVLVLGLVITVLFRREQRRVRDQRRGKNLTHYG